MDKLDIFKDELDLITSSEIKKLVSMFLVDVVPDYFFNIPASSTGKYHPAFSLGEGGLVRHTKAVVAMANELLTLEDMQHGGDVKDCIIASCILHDTFKNGYMLEDGKYSKWTVDLHPIIAADEWIKFCNKQGSSNTEANIMIHYCVAKHMGQWGPVSANYMNDGDYKDSAAALVHLADYIVSRKVLDKFYSH